MSVKHIYSFILVALLFGTVDAQKIDRSKPPKPGPAPVITLKDPVVFNLSNGITVMVVEDHKLPKVSATYSIDAGPVTEGEKAGVLGMMGSMLSEGTTVRSKADFDKAVDQMGASVDMNEGGGSASALTRYFEKAFLLMAEGLQKPAFDQEAFDKIQSLTITGFKTGERNVKTISRRINNALMYGIEHPFGEYTTEESLKGITLEDVKQYYTKYMTPSRGYLVFVGDIKPEAAKVLANKAFGNWKGNALSLEKLADVSNPSFMEINYVDVPNAVQSEIFIANLINMPLSNPDYFPLLLANQMLGGGSDAYLFKALREKRGFTYGAYSSFSADRYQSLFAASASVRNAKVDSAVIEFIDQINKIRNQKVDQEQLDRAKALYNGSFALAMENPARIAGFAKNVMLYNLPKDFYKTYLQKINAVTIDDIQRVAGKYFDINHAKIIVTGKGSDIAEGLKKLGYPVKQFDKYAKPVK